MTSGPHSDRLLPRVAALVASLALVPVASARTQTLTQRGFVDGRGVFFPQQASNDPRRFVGDVLAREEVFVRPTLWLRFSAGLDVRANSYRQVDRSWRLDLRDRGALRPALSMRRLNATLTHGPFTVDLGKQFIRWGKTDIVTPTDRFAPRDFLNVVDNEFLGVTGVRGVGQWGPHTLDAVWVPFFTPSRAPLLDQRWTALPPAAVPLRLVDVTQRLPSGSQAGLRWGHTGSGYDYSISYFDGFNHLPDIDAQPGQAPFQVYITRRYSRLRSVGVDLAVPTPWFTVKGEAAYSTSSASNVDELVIYVVQLERQTGEWVIVGGYAGEVVVSTRAGLPTFAPDRGLTRAFVGRASYTIDTNRSVAVETAIRQTGRGAYAKGEYSHARGAHWRATMAGDIIHGAEDDFLGQYHRNSSVTLSLRYSF